LTAKEYLLSIKNTSKKIVVLNEELATIRADKDNMKSVQISEKVKSSVTYANALDELMDREKEVIQEKRAVYSEWWRCRAWLKKISNREYSDVLRYYYLLNTKTWEKVAKKMHVSERRIYKIHGEALEEFRKITGLS